MPTTAQFPSCGSLGRAILEDYFSRGSRVNSSGLASRRASGVQGCFLEASYLPLWGFKPGCWIWITTGKVILASQKLGFIISEIEMIAMGPWLKANPSIPNLGFHSISVNPTMLTFEVRLQGTGKGQ